MINNDDDTTISKIVDLSIITSESGNDLIKMQFANSSSGPWSALEDFSSLKAGWILSSGPGIKTVYLKAYDNIGNYTIVSDTISLSPGHNVDNSKPCIGFKLILL